MQFDPVTHTKEFLLANIVVAIAFAESSSAFAAHPLAQDFEVLSSADSSGDSIAYFLAIYQSEWIHSEAVKSPEILKLTDKNEITVAHWLAMFQSDWVHSDAAKSFEILKLADNEGITVALNLAWHQPEWIHSEAAKSFEILKLADNDGITVAHVLVDRNKHSIHHQPLMQKEILTLNHKGKILAEFIAEKYKSDGFDLPVMAMKLIEQGAAYKHSKTIEHHIGESLLYECKLLLEDSHEPLIAFKQLQAAYSTFAHNVAKIISTQEQESLQEWKGLLLQSESLIRQHLNENPELYDIEHTADIFCEPGDDLLKKLQSERVLASDLTSLNRLNNTNCSEQDPKIQSLY
jgi:hypothetical protein